MRSPYPKTSLPKSPTSNAMNGPNAFQEYASEPLKLACAYPEVANWSKI
jgi:hypothetical protein